LFNGPCDPPGGLPHGQPRTQNAPRHPEDTWDTQLGAPWAPRAAQDRPQAPEGQNPEGGHRGKVENPQKNGKKIEIAVTSKRELDGVFFVFPFDKTGLKGPRKKI